MKIKELIEKLQEFDPNLEIAIDAEHFGLLTEIRDVYLQETSPFHGEPNVVLVR